MTEFLSFWIWTWPAVWLYFAPMVAGHAFYAALTLRNWRKDRAALARFRAQWPKYLAADEWRTRRGLEFSALATAGNSPQYLAWLAVNPRPPDEDFSYPMYYPTDKVGDVLGRIIVCWTPGLNLWVATFSLLPDVLGRYWEMLRRMLEQPLVPGDRK